MSTLTEDQLINFIKSKIMAMKLNGADHPFYMLDLGSAKDLMDQWTSKFPNIKPFYSVKCNPDPIFLATLAMLGASFDCASQREIELVLGLGIPAEKIVFGNTCKPISHIKYAASVSVNISTYDSEYEVEKIKKWHPRCSLLLRIAVGDDSKFGACPDEVIPLLESARIASLPVIGVSFHLHTSCAVKDPKAYHRAILSAKEVFNAALKLGMPRLHVLDIGGGFVSDKMLFDESATKIKDALKFYLGDEPDVETIAEPGQFFAHTPFTLVVSVIGKRVRSHLKEYWINDGLHGSMSFLVDDPSRAVGAVTPIACESKHENPTFSGEETFASTVHGPTCDSRDTILSKHQLPDLKVGDCLVLREIGAYAASIGSKFNGFDVSDIPTYVCNPILREQDET